MLCCVVPEVRHLLILAITVTTEDKGFTRVVVPAFMGIDRLFATGRVVCTDDSMRPKLGKKDDQKERRQNAGLILFLYQF